MNKLVLTFLLVLSSLSGFSQNKIGDKHVVYIELLGKTSMFSTKVKVSVDLGQPLSETYKLRDEDGKPLKFNFQRMGVCKRLSYHYWKPKCISFYLEEICCK